jgi:hypothetical protein
VSWDTITYLPLFLRLAKAPLPRSASRAIAHFERAKRAMADSIPMQEAIANDAVVQRYDDGSIAIRRMNEVLDLTDYEAEAVMELVQDAD